MRACVCLQRGMENRQKHTDQAYRPRGSRSGKGRVCPCIQTICVIYCRLAKQCVRVSACVFVCVWQSNIHYHSWLITHSHGHTHTLMYIHTAGTQCVVRDSKGKMTVRRQWGSSWETRLILLPLFPSVSLSPSLISLWLHVALSVPQQSFHTLFDCRQHHVSH